MKRLLLGILLVTGLMMLASCGGGGGGTGSGTGDVTDDTDTSRQNLENVYANLDDQEKQDFTTLLYNVDDDYVENAFLSIRDGVEAGLTASDIQQTPGSILRVNPYGADEALYTFFQDIVTKLGELELDSESLFDALVNIIDDIDEDTLEALGEVVEDMEMDGFDDYASEMETELGDFLEEEGIQIAAVNGVAVDPYIEDAVFCIDTNANYICDEGEPRSTETDDEGNFSFSVAPEDGDIIIMDVSGEHNGVPYAYDSLMGVYSGGEIVVSPVTTLNALGFTEENIMALFTAAGLTDINQAYLFTDPMDTIASGGEITADELAILRSSLMTYIVLRVLDGSDALSALSADELYVSAVTDGHALNSIITTAAEIVNSSLSQSTLDMLGGTSAVLESYGFPEIEFADVIRTAVTIADKLSEIGYEKCNETNGDYGQALTAVQDFITNTTSLETLISNLGPAYYFMRVEDQLTATQQTGAVQVNPAYGTYMECDTAFVIQDNGSFACYSE